MTIDKFKPFAQTAVVVVLLWICGGISATQTLDTLSFEDGTIGDWSCLKKKGSSNVVDKGVMGQGRCLKVQLVEPGTVTIIRRQFLLVATDVPKTRLLRISLDVRSEGVEEDGLSIWLLTILKNGKKRFVHLERTEDRGLISHLPVDVQWQRGRGEFFLPPDVVGFIVYIRAKNAVDAATVWLDNISVELLDRGIYLNFDKVTNVRGHILTSDRAEIPLYISGADKLKSGTITLFDECGRRLNRLNLKPGVSESMLILPTRGYYEIVQKATYLDGVKFRTRTRASVVGPVLDKKVRMESRFGVTAGQKDNGMLLAGGVRWLRHQVNLNRIPKHKPAGGKKETPWTKIHIFHEQPLWAQDRSGPVLHLRYLYPIAKNQKKRFAEAIRTYIENYPEPIRYIEIANEPICNFKKGTLKDIVEYHRLVSRCVKKVDPTITVMGPSLCNLGPTMMKNLESMVDMGLFDAIDMLSVHAYVKATMPECEFIHRVRELKKILANVRKEHMPIVVTEYGWTLPPGDWQKPVNELTHARYCARSLILLTAEQMEAILYFKTHPNRREAPAYGYAMVDWPDPIAKPTFSAYANAVRWLSSVKSAGKCLNVRPSTYLVLFEHDDGTLLATWDVEGENTVWLPKNRLRMMDMMGRPVESKESVLPINPSPMFAELSDASLYRLQFLKTRSITQGRTASLPIEPVWVPTPLQVEGKALRVPPETSGGRYTAIGRDSNGWMAIPIDVVALFEIISAELNYPIRDERPCLKVKIRSNYGQSKKVNVIAHWDDSTVDITVPATTADGSSTVAVPLDFLAPYHRVHGYVQAALIKDRSPTGAKLPVDITWVPCPALESNQAICPLYDISDWETGGNENLNDPVLVNMAYDANGLKIVVKVKDDLHVSAPLGKNMWQADSIQCAFDVDAELPWQGNVGGWNGHYRVYEYGAALHKGVPVTWRWISRDSKLPSQCPAPEIIEKITRERSWTTYRFNFPWKSLGLKKAPSAGRRIGFALLVNDLDDAKGKKRTTTFFNGIKSSKDPSEFGSLWLR